jgi:hypothetical protein
MRGKTIWMLLAVGVAIWVISIFASAFNPLQDALKKSEQFKGGGN